MTTNHSLKHRFGVTGVVVVFGFVGLWGEPAFPQDSGPALRARVTEVLPESGDVRIRLTAPESVRIGRRGYVQTNSGGVEVRVTSVSTQSEIWAHEVRRGEARKIRIGDPAVFYPDPGEVADRVNENLSRIDRLLGEQLPRVPPAEFVPDFLADVTGEVLDDYEAWLLQLETEPLPVPELPEIFPEKPEKKPVYPDLDVFQTFRTGTDYFRSVTASTAEDRIGRFLRWNYLETGNLWKDRSIRFENELEANDFFVSDEFEIYSRRSLPDGDYSWWRNRSIWRVFLNGQGDPFAFNDLEIRRVQKLSEEWDWQTGVSLQLKREYNFFSDDSYWRGGFSTEWNYFTIERFFNVTYELNRQRYRNADRRSSDYWRHDLTLSYYASGETWDLDAYGRFEFFDSNRPRREGDEYRNYLNATLSRPLTGDWRLRLQGTVEPLLYPVTEDINTNVVRLEFSPSVEYSGETLFFSAGPRVAQVFHFGRVPGDVYLEPDLPRDKSKTDFREMGFGLLLFWTPSEKWRVNLSEDFYYRWFPSGETGGIAFYISDQLVDEDRLANSTTLFTTFSVDYLWSEDLELSFRLSLNEETFTTYDENDNSTLDIGIEFLYRY